jgi:PAS domain-containing protein
MRNLTSRPDFLQLVLDALAEHVAVLQPDGTIAAVNRSWNSFCSSNGGNPGQWGVGANYHEVCWRAATVAADDDAARAHAGIKSVLLGQLASFTLEYPCHSPSERRWFLLSATPLHDETGRVLAAVVSHLNITRRRQLEDDLMTAQRELAAFQADPLTHT